MRGYSAVTGVLLIVCWLLLMSMLALGRAHPIWDLICHVGQTVEWDDPTSWPAHCDSNGWKE